MLKDFEYFLAVAEEGNITKAAERLHIAQPSLTQKLQRMEKALECTLLLRTNSGIKLTEAGKLYIRLARQILSLRAEFQNELSQQKNLSAGTLRIGASWYISTAFLGNILTHYSKLYPHIEINCTESRSSLLIEALQAGNIDIAFISLSPINDAYAKKHLIYKKLLRDEFQLVLAQKHWYATQNKELTEADLSQFAAEPFIMFHPNQRIRQITDSIFLQAQIQPPIKITTYGFPLALEQAACNNGAAILPTGYIESVKKLRPIRTFSIPAHYHASWDIAAIFPAFDFPPPALKAFLKLLEKLYPKTDEF